MTKKTKKAKIEAKLLPESDQKLPFLEHFKELKRRLIIVAVSIGIFATGAYFIQHQIVGLLLKPAEGQKLIYTTPAGGMNFLIQVCIYTGVVLSLPIIIYQILKYFEPLMGRKSVRFALFGSIISALLAIGGMAFGYFAGLPAVLHFLFHQFSPTSEIQPLIAVTSYMGFVTLYMFGAALLFQVPLVLVFINRIKRLKPRSLLKGERWFILFAFILAFIMNPTPNVVEQLFLAGPMIVMYQVGIGIIWLINRKPELSVVGVATPATAGPTYADQAPSPLRPPSRKELREAARRRAKIASLLEQDAAVQAERLAKLADAKQIWHEASTIADRPISSVVAIADHQPPKIIDATLYPQEQPPQSVQPTPTPLPTHAPTAVPVPVTVHTPAQQRAAAARPRAFVDGFSRNRHQHIR